MAYGSIYPATYQPMYYQQPTMQQPQMQNQVSQMNNSSMIWVQGEAGAKSYLVAPNNTVQLWDSEAQVIYLKSADASGMPSIKILDYTIRDNDQPTPHVMEDHSYATKQEVENLAEELASMKRRLDNISARPSRKPEKKEASEHE